VPFPVIRASRCVTVSRTPCDVCRSASPAPSNQAQLDSPHADSLYLTIRRPDAQPRQPHPLIDYVAYVAARHVIGRPLVP